MSQQFKNKKFIFISILLFLIIGAFLFWNYSAKNTSAAGEGWLSGWGNRRAVTISNNNQVGKIGTVTGATLGAAGKFGTAVSFDGTDDYISFSDSPDWDFGTGNFTIDTWVKFTGWPSLHAMIFDMGTSGACQLYWQYGVGLYWNNCIPGVSLLYNPSWTLNTWHHIAIVRNGTDIRMYLDGTSVASTTSSSSFIAHSYLSFGRRDDGYHFNGLIDEFRISKGVARWTSNFTPSTAAYEADAYDKLLLHFNETSGTTSYSNDNPLSKLGTLNGGATIGAAGKFGTAITLDGTDDYISLINSDDWKYGTGDYTIDFWTKFNSIAVNQAFFNQRLDDTHQIYAYWATANLLRFRVADGSLYATSVYAPWTPTTGTWYHIAIVRSSGVLKIYLNGTSMALTYDNGTGAENIPHIAGNLNVGMINHGSTFYLNGYIDEFRISKGIARWTSNFTPSTTAYTTDKYDVLLLHMDDVAANGAMSSNDSRVLTDYQVTVPVPYSSSMRPDFGDVRFTSSDGSTELSYWFDKGEDQSLGTVTGVTFGATGKFGTAASFDGTDNIVFPASSDFDFGTGNFTIDAWVNFSSTADEKTIAASANGSGWIFEKHYEGGSPGLHLYDTNASGHYVYAPYSFSTGTWYHVAVVRYGSVIKFFVNGSQIGTDQTPYSGGYNSGGSGIVVGKNISSFSTFNGSIDELRISKGIARWTSNFTPSTTAYEVDANTVALMHMDDVNGTTTVNNLKSFLRTGELYGGTTLGATGKFGTAASFDGAGDYISVPDSNDWNLGAGDFTIDFQVKFISDTGDHAIVGQFVDVNNNWGVWFDGGERMRFLCNVGGVTKAYLWGAFNPDPNVWYHIAIVRNGSNAYVFSNGTALSLTTATSFGTNEMGNFATDLKIGAWPGYSLNGQLDELRISKGIARWTSNFTPSTTAYESDAYTSLLLHMDEQATNTIVSSYNPINFLVKVPQIPAGSSTIYTYYGKSDALTTSNANNTFIVYDDFFGSSVDTTKWNVTQQNSGTFTVANGKGVAYTPASIHGAQGSITSKVFNFPGTVAEFRANVTLSGYVAYGMSGFISGFNADSTTSPSDYLGMLDVSSSSTAADLYLSRNNLTLDVAACSTCSGAYKTYKIGWYPTYVYSYVDNSLVGSTSQTNYITPNAQEFFFGGGTINSTRSEVPSPAQNHYIDWIRIRKYVYFEPTVSLNAGESIPTASLSGLSISTIDEDICTVDSTTGSIVCRSGQPITFTSTTSGTASSKLYVCKDSTCTNCGISSTSNCWAYSTSFASSNPTAIYNSSCYAGSCGTGECEYSTGNKYWGKVCTAGGVCSSIIAYDYVPYTSTCVSGGGLTCTETIAGINDAVYTYTLSGSTTGTTTMTVPQGVSEIEYLIVAGGGGGAHAPYGGGAGAGGLLTNYGTSKLSVAPGETLTIQVGLGGVGTASSVPGTNGTDSSLEGTSFAKKTAIGGAGGGKVNTTPGPSGGSGGGAGGNSGTTAIGGTGTSGQGNNGGGNGGFYSSYYPAGGGGGAGGLGGTPTVASQSGAGGLGLAVEITGSSVLYAAGGGGAGENACARGLGGSGIGGNGGSSTVAATAGTANTGSGGGGGSNAGNGGAGGSGIVIVRFTKP